MVTIDTSSWREFTLGGNDGLFDIVKGTRLKRADMDDGIIRFVGPSAFHNGITGMVSNSSSLHPANTLTVAYNGSVGETFYQDREFWASDDVNVLYPRFELTPNIGLFIASLIRVAGRPYQFIDKWKLDDMKAAKIPLPVIDDGSPDWSYMESYIARIVASCSGRVKSLESMVAIEPASPDFVGWKRFPIGGNHGLFRIEKGTRLTRADMREGNIPFIGASTANNGITGYVGNTEQLHPANVITVAYNGQKATGKAFYQTKPFWASDDVHVLYPNFELNELRAMFLLPIFRIVGKPYAFEDKWKIEYMETDELPLPVDECGNPDWDYMESYIQKQMDASRLIVEEFSG